MLGRVISFDKEHNDGEILGVDNISYSFHIGEWLSTKNIKIGERVKYDIEENEARNIIIEEELKENIIHLKIDVSFV